MCTVIDEREFPYKGEDAPEPKVLEKGIIVFKLGAVDYGSRMQDMPPDAFFMSMDRQYMYHVGIAPQVDMLPEKMKRADAEDDSFIWAVSRGYHAYTEEGDVRRRCIGPLHIGNAQENAKRIYSQENACIGVFYIPAGSLYYTGVAERDPNGIGSMHTVVSNRILYVSPYAEWRTLTEEERLEVISILGVFDDADRHPPYRPD